MLTGLLMLWMAAGEARGQSTGPENYTFSGGFFDNASVRGADVWYDGKYWTASLRFTGGAMATDLTCYTGTLGAYTWSIGLEVPIPFTGIWPNDLACGEPNIEFLLDSGEVPPQVPPNHQSHNNEVGSTIIDKSVAYGVGGFKTPLPTVLISEGEGGSDEFEVPSVPSTAAWLYCARLYFNSLPTVNDYVFDLDVNGFDSQFRSFLPQTSSDMAENTCVDTHPGTGGGINDYPLSQSVAVGGMFRGDVAFDCDSCYGGNNPPTGSFPFVLSSNQGTLDGYVVLLRPHSHTLIGSGPTRSVLPIGSPTGDDAVLGVSINHTTGAVLVCGYYSGADIDFDPDPINVYSPTNYAGGRDMFVASYRYDAVWELNWAWTYGTVRDDVLESVVADIAGNVFFTGWVGAGTCSPPLPCQNDPFGDIFVGGITVDPINEPPTPPIQEPYSLMWSHTIEGTGDEKGLDICVDYLGRPVVTGYFGQPGNPNPGYTIDINPDPNVQQLLTSQGNTDGFAVRFDPMNGELDWAFSFGDSTYDSGMATNIDQYNSSRWVIGGEGTNQGFVDTYSHNLEIPESTAHITLIVDNVHDILAPNHPLASGQLTQLGFNLKPFTDAIADPTIVTHHPNVHFGGVEVSIDVIVEDTRHFNDRNLRLAQAPGNESTRMHYMRRFLPPTLVTDETRTLIARRLRAMQDYFEPSGSTVGANMGETLAAAADYISVLYPGTASRRQALFIAPRIEAPFTGSPPMPLIETGIQNVRHDVTNGNPAPYKMVHALGVKDQVLSNQIDRVAAVERVTEASGQLDYQTGWSTQHQNYVPGEDESGLAAEAPGFSFIDGNGQRQHDPRYYDLARILMARMSHCPGDYDRSGTATQLDIDRFLDDTALRALGLPIGHPVSEQYPDWNLDWPGIPMVTPFDGDQNQGAFVEFHGPDWSKFFHMFTFGGCP